MKKVIIAAHTGMHTDNMIRFWEYDKDTINYWCEDESDYAIVENSSVGYQLVKIVGIAKVRNDFEVKARVVSFLSNDNFDKVVKE